MQQKARTRAVALKENRFQGLVLVLLCSGEADWEEGLCVDLQAADWQAPQTWLDLLQPQSIWSNSVISFLIIACIHLPAIHILDAPDVTEIKMNLNTMYYYYYYFIWNPVKEKTQSFSLCMCLWMLSCLVWRLITFVEEPQ